MYNQTEQPTANAQSMLNSAVSKLRADNIQKAELLLKIDDKLHSILNRREPQAPSGGDKQSPNDLGSELFDHLGVAANQTLWLERIYNHLCEIA